LNVAAVGRKTCELLESHGVRVAFVPEREDSVGLVEGLSSTLGNSHASILLPQGEEAPDTIEHGLGTPGHKVTRINIYRTVPTSAAELPDIGIDDIGFFIFTSPLSVSYFKALGHKLPEKAWVAAIGQPTAKALISDFRAPDFVPGKADLKAIVEKIKERL
jgi:uroporphyrinogen-III synthase